MKKFLLAFAVCLLACSGAEDDSRPALTQAELLDPESCKDCHPKHYEQWSASMHAYATNDPVFLAMNKRAQEETNGELGTFCINCHAPMAVQQNMVSDVAAPENIPQELKGVTCYFCHNAVGVGADHFNGNVTLANDNVMRAAIRNPIEPTTHKAAYSAFHDPASDSSSQLCGTCHDINTPKGVRLERTYEEYLGSIFGSATESLYFQSCQDCHMARAKVRRPIAESTGRPMGSPGSQVQARDYHEHLWPAVDIALTEWPHADAMQSAVSSCVLPNSMSSFFTVDRDPGPLGQLTVTMEADPGHMFPSGAVQDRRLWLELIAYDETNTEMFRIGQVGDQEIEETKDAPHPCMFRDYIVDDAGNETHDFHKAAKIEKTHLMPVAAKGSDPSVPHSIACANLRPPLAMAINPPAYIDMKLKMRPMGIDVLQDLASTGHLDASYIAKMPTFTVVSRRATYLPDSRSYGVAPLNDEPGLGDCHTYLCMLDPMSPECLASQSTTTTP